MVPHLINASGTCHTCKTAVSEAHVLDCYICKEKYHGKCKEVAPWASNTFVKSFVSLKSTNFVFVCDHCQTDRENTEASTLKEQMAKVVAAVANLSKDVADLKKEKVAPAPTPADVDKPVAKKKVTWADKTRVENVKESKKVTVCIKKTNESNLDIKKVKEVVTQHGLQVSKVSVNQKNGDLYVDFPSDEQRDKLVPLLTAEEGNNVINIKSKCPVITIRNVSNFVDNDTFIAAVKSQNPQICEKIENGSEFSILFTKEHQAREAPRNTQIVLMNLVTK